MRQALEKALGGKKMEELSPEDRQKIFAKVREAMGGAGQRAGTREGGAGQRAATSEAGGGRRGGADEAGEGRPTGMRAGGPPAIAGLPGLEGAGGVQFARPSNVPTEEQLAKAKLPPSPEQDSQLEVLVRPGLLSDVEIIVEKIPNAINVPAQAVFEKDGKQIVYVKVGNRFQERPVQLAKRSESVMVIESGLKEGEIVALADPNARPGDEKKGAAKSSGGNPMGAVPGGGGGGGGGSRGGGR
jgi:hypothetical protein